MLLALARNSIAAQLNLASADTTDAAWLQATGATFVTLTINGTLRFSDAADVELTTEWIMLHGELQIGTEAKPHTRKATITLTDTVKGEELMGMGDRGIMLSGGTLNLHGDRTNSWTKLAKTAIAGSSARRLIAT